MQRILSVLLSAFLILTQLAACAPKRATPLTFDSRVKGDEDGDGGDDDGGSDDGGEDGGEGDGGEDDGGEDGDEGEDSPDEEGFDSQTIKKDGEGNPIPEGKEVEGGSFSTNGAARVPVTESHEVGERVVFDTDGVLYSMEVKSVCNDCTVDGKQYPRFYVFDRSSARVEGEGKSGTGPSIAEKEPMTKESEEFFSNRNGTAGRGGNEENDPKSPKEKKRGIVTKDSLNVPSGEKSFREFMQNERKTISESIEKSVKKSADARPGANGSTKGYTKAHNDGIGDLSKSLPGAKSRGKSSPLKTPPDSPLGASMRNTQRFIDFVEHEGNGDKKLTGLARRTLKKADEKAQQGDLTGAEKRRKAAQDIADGAACQGCKPPPAGPAPKDVESPSTFNANDERSHAYGMGTGMYDAANDLDDAGLPEVADETRKTAAAVMNVALGIARMSNLLDIPMSAAEAFTGMTVDIDDDGNPRIREATKAERVVAVVSLGLIAGAAVLGAGVGGVVAAGVIGKIGNVIRGAEKSRALEKAALEAAEKGLVGVEKEALEKAAAELAEKEAEDIAKTASKLEKSKKKIELTNDLEKKFSEGALAPDKGGLTRAGRALQKHSNRAVTAFPKTNGPPENWNKEGQKIVDSILKDPGKTVIEQSTEGLGVFDVIASDGRGLRFWGSGILKGFLEP